MSTVRRRVLRPGPPVHTADDGRQLAADKKHRHLERERIALGRWMTRLKRAFHAVERSQLRVSRLERKIAQLEQG